MGNNKVLVVDDSPFSRNIISDALTQGGLEVVGHADGMKECMEMFRRHQPDLVTMDMVMPGADGLECVRALRVESPDVKVVIISSMKDDELMEEARKLNVIGYVQKPVNAEELLAVIRNSIAPDAIYTLLDNLYLDLFKEAFLIGIAMCTNTKVEFTDSEVIEGKYSSLGVAVVMGIVGRYSGSMVFDLSLEAATQLTRCSLRREPKNLDESMAMVAEFANIIGGNACSMLNKKYKELHLRVTPPSVFFGGSPEITSPNLEKKALYAETIFGRMHLNVGFRRGVEIWM
jgi:CheY-like chemotaxis protein/CheY-specific phosphatase CheX